MSAQVKEALTVLATHFEGDGPSHYSQNEIKAAHATIRSALEAAQQEAEAWEATEAWRLAGRPRTVVVTLGADIAVIGLLTDDPLTGFTVCESTRLEALTKAATWCRAEMGK